MNILTFDIEEWYLESIKYGRKEKFQEFDRLLKEILAVLDETATKATFFCLGKIASDFPEIVKLIESKGHEIGCHSNKHLWLTKMNSKELLEDTNEAIDSLQQLIGKKVLSYRAPAFSITAKNKEALEILSRCGIERDASIFPLVRDFGGFPEFKAKEPVVISYNGIEIKEFPISPTKILGKEFAYSGGGYFRFFPYKFIKNKINNSDYSMTYFHIGDLISEKQKLLSRVEYENYFKEEGTILNRYKRYIKSNIGTSNACEKLFRLIREFDFVNIGQADALLQYKKISI